MILGFKKWSGLALTTLLFAYAAVAGEMPFPSIENGKVKLVVADSPYLLEQGAVFSAKDTLEIEPGVTVLMGEYAKLMFRGSVKIIGTEAAPVVFKSADSVKSWNGVHFVSANRPFEIKNLIIENAFRQEGDEYIYLTLCFEDDGTVVLHIRDNAVNFNPFGMVTGRDYEDAEQLASLGIQMVKAKSKQFFYRRYAGFNTLTVEV